MRSLPTHVEVPRLSRDRQPALRAVPEECPVALVYDGTTAAVVMATPADLADLAVGFSLTERVIRSAEEINELEMVPAEIGIELRMWLAPCSGLDFKSRQRRLIGPTGCGLCGIESLSEAMRPSPKLIRRTAITATDIKLALNALSNAQELNRETHATHAAGFYSTDNGPFIAREDVGRHNALDKLAGAMATRGVSGRDGAVVLTSRVSIEMVQKTAAIGCSILIAISAPTALAVRTADDCGITLIAVARGSEFEIFTHPDGIVP